ncbi:MAG: hypothetical protein M3O82_02580 [Verrucomicrobiota bacterium]|nr:hypothetical protein [Verrucomicrobiota bacterium]
MERLQKDSPGQTLTAAQKAEIAEIDSSFRAKIAERELFLHGEIARTRAGGKPDEADSLEKQLANEIRRLKEDCETRKQKARSAI